MTPAEITAFIAARSYSPAATHLGGDRYRVTATHGDDLFDAVLTVAPSGDVTGALCLSYTLDGKAEDPVTYNREEFGEFPLDSYVGIVFFDAMFG